MTFQISTKLHSAPYKSSTELFLSAMASAPKPASHRWPWIIFGFFDPFFFFSSSYKLSSSIRCSSEASCSARRAVYSLARAFVWCAWARACTRPCACMHMPVYICPSNIGFGQSARKKPSANGFSGLAELDIAGLIEHSRLLIWWTALRMRMRAWTRGFLYIETDENFAELISFWGNFTRLRELIGWLFQKI